MAEPTITDYLRHDLRITRRLEAASLLVACLAFGVLVVLYGLVALVVGVVAALAGGALALNIDRSVRIEAELNNASRCPTCGEPASEELSPCSNPWHRAHRPTHVLFRLPASRTTTESRHG